MEECSITARYLDNTSRFMINSYTPIDRRELTSILRKCSSSESSGGPDKWPRVFSVAEEYCYSCGGKLTDLQVRSRRSDSERGSLIIR